MQLYREGLPFWCWAIIILLVFFPDSASAFVGPFLPQNAQRSCFLQSTTGLTPARLLSFSGTSFLQMKTEASDVVVKSRDGESLQLLFSSECDSDGLMTKETIAKIPGIAELLEDGSLESFELDEIWAKAPKFPDVEGSSVERVDVDSFIQIYRDIDDLFEADEEENESAPASLESDSSADTVTTPASKDDTSSPSQPDAKEQQNVQDEMELEDVFRTNLADKDGLLSKQGLLEWDEVKQLVADGLLGLEDEFEQLWEQTAKSPGTDMLDVDGFLSFNVALDDLFELEDEDNDGTSKERTVVGKIGIPPEALFLEIADENGVVGMEDLVYWGELQDMLKEGSLLQSELDSVFGELPKTPGGKLDRDAFVSLWKAIDDLFEDDDEGGNIDDEIPTGDDVVEKATKQDAAPPPIKPKRKVVTEDDLPAGVMFSRIADENLLVGMDELKLWGALGDMLNSGDLLPRELQEIFQKTPKVEGRPDKMDESGFSYLYDTINDLFEEYDEEEEQAETVPRPKETTAKADLLQLLERLDSMDDRAPCGIEASEKEEEAVLNAITELEKEPTNLITTKLGKIEESDITGNWDLLYTSSSAVRFNKGLTGLARTVPQGKFGGLQQKLEATKFTADVEYTERIESAAGAGFNAKVIGNWELTTTVSVLTGVKTTSLKVEPDRVEYGVASQKSDYWKSLGPMNLLDVTYLDDDLRVMRGNTFTKAFFIFKKL